MRLPTVLTAFYLALAVVIPGALGADPNKPQVRTGCRSTGREGSGSPWALDRPAHERASTPFHTQTLTHAA